VTLREDLPAWLVEIVRRLLQRDPDRRFQTARELINALDRARPGSLRQPVRHAAAVLVLPALLYVGWAVLGRDRAASPSTFQASASSTAPLHTVAVLPLIDATGRSDLAWLSRGFAEMMAMNLGESPALRVVDSSRVFQTVQDLGLSGGPLDPGDLQRLADLLDADRLVAGRVWAAGDRLRVDLTLAAGPGGSPVSTLRAEGESEEEVFAMAGTLSRGLRERFAVEPSTAGPVTASPEALHAYDRGLELLLRRDAPAAVRELQRAVTTDPGFTPAWVRLARALAGIGRQSDALEAARRAAATPGAQSGRASLEVRALEARLRGEPAKAREILGKLLASYPHDTEARIELAEVCREQGDLNAAIAALRRVVAREPDHGRAWLLLAKAAILAGDSRRAVDDYLVHALVVQNRLGSEAGRTDVLNAFGVAHHELGEIDRAQESYDQAAAIRRRLGDERGTPEVRAGGSTGRISGIISPRDAPARKISPRSP
jgi:Tfp pilus assembly protein PilF/TolB-like protein